MGSDSWQGKEDVEYLETLSYAPLILATNESSQTSHIFISSVSFFSTSCLHFRFFIILQLIFLLRVSSPCEDSTENCYLRNNT